MNSLDQLSNQSKILLEIIDKLVELIKKAKDELNNGNFSKSKMIDLNNCIKKTLALSKSFMENYNEFMEDQIN